MSTHSSQSPGPFLKLNVPVPQGQLCHGLSGPCHCEVLKSRASVKNGNVRISGTFPAPFHLLEWRPNSSRPNPLAPPGNEMGNCFGKPAVGPSMPQPQVAMDPIPPPVLSHPNADMSSVPLSRTPSRTRSRTGSRAESIAHSRLPSQGPDTRTRRTSAPVPPPPGPSMPEISRPRTKSAANPRKPTRSESRPTNQGKRDDSEI
jgi:hypothetical protein